jgi:hypothetical protein
MIMEGLKMNFIVTIPVIKLKKIVVNSKIHVSELFAIISHRTLIIFIHFYRFNVFSDKDFSVEKLIIQTDHSIKLIMPVFSGFVARLIK